MTASSLQQVPLGPPGAATPEGRLRFETLLSNVTAALLTARAGELDAAIQASVSDLGAYLGSERGGVGLFSEDGRSLFYKYGYFAAGASTLFYETDLAQAVPWYIAQVRAGRTMVVRRPLDELPPEAGAGRRPAAARGG